MRLVDDVSKPSFWNEVLQQPLFEICKERLLRNLRSWVKERPDSQCDVLMSYLLQEGQWLPSDKIAACENTDLTCVQDRLTSSLQYTAMTLYAHGSMEKDTALAVQRVIKKNMKSSNSELKVESTFDRGRILNPGHVVVALPGFNPEDPNSALLTHIQADMTSPRTSALLLFMRRMLAEPAFTELRTKKQLGYIVSLFPSGYGRSYFSIRGVTIRILSKRFSPLEMEAELATFLSSQRQAFEDLTALDVQEKCESIVKSLEDPPTQYTEEAAQYWDAILTHMPTNWTEMVIQELKTLSLDDITQAAKQWIFDHDRRRSISMMLFGNTHLKELESYLISSKNGDHFEENKKDVFFGSPSVRISSIDELTAYQNLLPYTTNVCDN